MELDCWVVIIVTKHWGWRRNKLELQQIKNVKHRAIIKHINEGIDTDTILKRHGISKPSYFRIKRRYQDALVEVQSSDIVNQDIANFDTKLIDKGKFIALKLANALIKKNTTGASVSQLTTSLINVNNMIRLQEGKSAENIAHNVLHNLGDAELTLIRESIAHFKKEMVG